LLLLVCVEYYRVQASLLGSFLGCLPSHDWGPFPAANEASELEECFCSLLLSFPNRFYFKCTPRTLFTCTVLSSLHSLFYMMSRVRQAHMQ
jgi:hypothetical protein